MARDYTRFIQTTHPLRKEGTELKVASAGGVHVYHFRPNPVGHYVAEVLDDGDRRAILSISAGYRPYAPTADEVRTLRRSEDGVPGIDTGEITDEAKAKDAANRVAGMAAANNVTVPPKMPETLQDDKDAINRERRPVGRPRKDPATPQQAA